MTGMNGWRNVVIAGLTSVVITGGVAWFTWGVKAVSRDDVTTMLATDRQATVELRQAVRDLTGQVQTHGEQLARFTAIVERLERQIERGRVP